MNINSGRTFCSRALAFKRTTEYGCAVTVYTDNSLAARIARLVRRVLG